MANTNGSTTANKRLDLVESDLKNLATIQGEQGRQLATVATEVSSISKTQHETAGKLDQLLARGAGTEATKGMISVQSVMWAIGMLIALCSLGVTALMFFSNSIKSDIDTTNNAIENSQKAISDFYTREFDPIKKEVQLMLTNRFRREDFEIFIQQYHIPLIEKVNDLVTEQAINKTLIDSNIKELNKRGIWIEQTSHESSQNKVKVEDLKERFDIEQMKNDLKPSN